MFGNPNYYGHHHHSLLCREPPNDSLEGIATINDANIIYYFHVGSSGRKLKEVHMYYGCIFFYFGECIYGENLMIITDF